MLIVVEGCDGVGKSTLVDLLQDRHIAASPQYDIVKKLHYGPPKRHPLEEYELDLQDYRPGQGRHLLIDRLHWGEEIYGPLYRGGTRLGEAGARHVDMFLNAVGGVVVWLDLPEGQIRRRLTATREDFLQSEHVTQVIDGYFNQARASIANLMTFNAPCDKVDADDILAYATSMERRAEQLNGFDTYIGQPNPTVLLLGDKRNHPTEQKHRLAFVPYANTSGRYLLGALPRSFLQVIGIANACEENLWTLWNVLGHPAVVALGVHAANKIEDFGAIPYAEVPHPQYVRRFHHKRRAEYGALIRRAAAARTGRFQLP